MLASKRSMQLVSETLPAAPLDAGIRDEMWGVFRRYYDAVTREVFERDLGRKRHVILLRDSGDGTLQGFSTLALFDREVEGRRVVAIFSGDTIISEGYWGQTALQRAFFRYIMRTKLSRPFTPVYWFLISKGYKTYLLLSRNFPEHWPRHEEPTPPWQGALLDQLAHSLYPEAWRPELGVLRFERCEGRLRDGVAPIESHMLEDADIRFFAKKNPGHARGDELCCLGRVDRRLAAFYALKMLKQSLGLGRAKARPALPAASPSPYGRGPG